MSTAARMGCTALVAALLFTGNRQVFADGSTSARSTDAVVKEWVDEFQGIRKKKPTIKGKERQLELIRGMEFGPCGTAQRFLLDLLKKKKTPGDQRLYALRALLRMADEKTFGKMLKALTKAKDPTLWHVFGQELLVRPSDAIREWSKEPALKSRNAALLCAYLEARARKPDVNLVGPIGDLFEKHASKEKGSIEIAYCAFKALLRMSPTVGGVHLTQALEHPDWRLRLAAADAFASVKRFATGVEGDAERAVRKLIQDESPYVQRAAIEAAGRAKLVSVSELLISKLSDRIARTRHVAARALESISGQKLGHDAKAWAKWLAKQDPGTAVEIEAPRYHGIEIHSDHVVFVVDASSSMTWPWRKDTHRIDVALMELEKTLSKLAPETLFNVMVFSEDHVSWKKASVSATSQNTAAAGLWAKTAMAKPDGDTFFYEAIRAALTDHPDCDTIFLLTDGNPTAGRYWSVDGLAASVRGWTRYKRVAINTVGLSLLNMDRGMPNLSENPATMKRVLSAIAAATSGEFREILDAPK